MTPRERAIAWAAEVAADPSAVFVDTETTGLGPDAEIVDIAIVGTDGRVLLDSLVCPLRRIPAEATAMHGLTEKHVQKAPFWKELYPRVASVLAGRNVVCWNTPYDFGVINGVCRADKLPEFPGPWEDAMKHFGAFTGERSRRGDGYRWWKLGEAAERLGIAVPSAHRALADCLTTLAVVKAMAAAGAEPVQTGLPLGDAPGLRQPIGRDWTEEAKGGTR